MTTSQQQNVWVRATMPQRYKGVQKGSGDTFEMLNSDADDSVALNMVTRLKPEDVPGARKPVVTTRTMEATDGDATTPGASETDTTTASTADKAAQAAQTAASARNSTPQQRYPHRNMQARR